MPPDNRAFARNHNGGDDLCLPRSALVWRLGRPSVCQDVAEPALIRADHEIRS
jgi:hypothetical protein